MSVDFDCLGRVASSALAYAKLAKGEKRNGIAGAQREGGMRDMASDAAELMVDSSLDTAEVARDIIAAISPTMWGEVRMLLRRKGVEL